MWRFWKQHHVRDNETPEWVLLATRFYMNSVSYFVALNVSNLLWCGEALLQWDVLFILVLGQQANASTIFCVALDSSVIRVTLHSVAMFPASFFMASLTYWILVQFLIIHVPRCVRRIFDCLLCVIETLDFLVQPRSPLAHVQIGWTTALYNNNLFS